MKDPIHADLPDAVVFADLQADTGLDVMGQAAVTQGFTRTPDFGAAACAEVGRRAPCAEGERGTRWNRMKLADAARPGFGAEALEKK